LSAVARAFAGVAAGYDSWYATPKGRRIFEAEKKLLERLLPPKGLGIEIGAGTGIFAEGLKKRTRLIVCVDITPEMLAHARNRGLPCILGSAYALPLRVGCVGFAYMVTVAEFLDPIFPAFMESRCTLNPGGKFTVLFINRDSSWGELYSKMSEAGDLVFRHAHLLSVDDIERALNVVGYEVQKVLGTLTAPPNSEEVGDKILAPGPLTGVVAVSATVPNQIL
jgi:ubiquinone/menaquinone biosynthesis C-methylase UbiE